MLHFRDYHEQARQRFDPSVRGTRAMLLASLGLASESGRILDAVKKNLFHGHKFDEPDIYRALGQLLFYAAWLTDTFGEDLSYVARQNLNSLALRDPHLLPESIE